MSSGITNKKLTYIEYQILSDRIPNEILRQDRIHPHGYPYTRDGMRLGICALSDETDEVFNEWMEHKRRFPEQCDELETEILQVIVVGIRMLRSAIAGRQ